MEKQSSL